jgi:hypothetical protein
MREFPLFQCERSVPTFRSAEKAASLSPVGADCAVRMDWLAAKRQIYFNMAAVFAFAPWQ